MKNNDLMALRQNHFHSKTPPRSDRNRALLHWLTWLLLAAALFYGMHRYFEYREHELDERLERLQ